MTGSGDPYRNEAVTLVPTIGGNVPEVDSKGRITLPKRLRERLGIEAGTEVILSPEQFRELNRYLGG